MWSLYRVKDDLKDGWHDRNWEPGLRWLKGLSNQEIIEIEQYWHRLRWLEGLSEQEIVEIEQHWQLQFPPDYRLFLKMLHSTNEKCVSGEIR